MKVGQDFFPKSRFLSVDKDFALITQKILSNPKLLKMLYYTEKDCLKAKDLSPEQAQSMLHKQIKIIPRITIDKECPINIIITMDAFPDYTKFDKTKKVIAALQIVEDVDLFGKTAGDNIKS